METFKEQNEKINQIYYNASDCIDRCLECHRVCLSTLQHCLALGGKYADYRPVSLMLESADICRVTADFIESTSEFSRELAELCAKVCTACAESCNQVDPEDGHMVDCTLACIACAEACRNADF